MAPPVAVLGPPLVTLIVYVRFAPTITGSGESVLVIARSAEGLIVVSSVAELLPRLGSNSLALTVAVLLTTPACVGVTTMVTVAEPPFATVPRLQLTVLVSLQLP